MPETYQDALKSLGLTNSPALAEEYSHDLDRLIDFRLVSLGLLDPKVCPDPLAAELAEGQREQFRQHSRLLANYRAPVDARIEGFLKTHLEDVADPEGIKLPDDSLTLDRHGIARKLSLPLNSDTFENQYVQSTRIANGVLHNPRNDRRTTKGTFHVAEGGLPIPAGKKSVPKAVFAKLLQHAVRPPDDLMELPFTDGMDQKAKTWVSLLLRPLVCPPVEGVRPAKSMEVRFFVPGALVSNLDFVESIFGNAGDPELPQNDAAIDVQGWSGHTGCVILAPHLEQLTKKQLGLPHISEATDIQKRDGMCWENEDEKYNEGGAFKITCRTESGVIVTLIADNYFGYCKKEVKTQISYAANLMGWAEEEHAGGTIAFPSYNLGLEFKASNYRYNDQTFADVVASYADQLEVDPKGFATDLQFEQIIYVPEDTQISAIEQTVSWHKDGETQSIRLRPDRIYITPSGYRVQLEKHPAAPSWRLFGTIGEGAVCHKPCTVSGGGKSEISKPLNDYMLYGPIYVADYEQDMALCQTIINRDYSDRWLPELVADKNYTQNPTRPILSDKRSLGSVIKLLTPSDDYTDDFNQWLASIPAYIFPIVFSIKRLYEPEWGNDWQSHFTVETVNGFPGHELKIDNRTVTGSYLRVGLDHSGAWRTFKLRQDFLPSQKISIEDDITASVVLPAKWLTGLNPKFDPMSVKFVQNCEFRFFQRPDDAIHRGLDTATEFDLAQSDNFISNFEPLNAHTAKSITNDVIDFDAYSQPMKDLIANAASKEDGYVVSSAHPRLVNGVPTKNPRYLQTRPDLRDPIQLRLADVGVRLHRGIPADQPAPMPVNTILMGRRNNPPDDDAGIRGLAVYNPLHYQELPELFMDFVCSLTGKSPSTTGAGSEGALTKRPFNALRPATDLNNALVSYILTNLAGYSTSAGYVGPNFEFGHDISLLIPEVVSRMTPQEIDPQFLIDHHYLEKIHDFEFEGQTILASRLGYRINKKFANRFLARIFDNPNRVFTTSMLQPELQDMAAYVDGILNITEAQKRVAMEYFDGGGIVQACPPLKILLHIMAYGDHDGMTSQTPEFRDMFSLKSMLESDWYQERLTTQQSREIDLYTRHTAYLQKMVNDTSYAEETQRLHLDDRLQLAEKELKRVSENGYAQTLSGCLGADPLVP